MNEPYLRTGAFVYLLEEIPPHQRWRGSDAPDVPTRRNRWSAAVQRGPDTPLEECVAIAKLLQQAWLIPELVEALKKAAAGFEELHARTPCPDCPDTYDEGDACPALDMVCDVLRKYDEAQP